MIVRIKMLFLDAMKELEKGKPFKREEKETQRFKKMDNYVVCFEWEILGTPAMLFISSLIILMILRKTMLLLKIGK